MTLISSHIPFREPAQFADHVRPFVADSAEKTVGYHVDKASLNEKGEVRSDRAREVQAIRNHRRYASGPKITAAMRNKLNQEVQKDYFLTAHLSTAAAHAVKRSNFEQLAAGCEKIAESHNTSAEQARSQAVLAHDALYALIKGTPLGEKKANELLGGPELNDAIYLKPLSHERIGIPAELAKHHQLFERFFDIQSSLKQELKCKELCEQYRELKQINLTLFETMRHPSYRFLARIFSAPIRAQMNAWLGTIGMLTMIASFPLMYVGLKQWVESLHQPHESAAQ